MGMNKESGLILVGSERVVFQHIPKTGGQSVYRAFGVPLRQHLPPTHRVRREELMECSYAFAFIRDPYSRAVSTFHWLHQLHLKPIRRRPDNAIFNQWCRNTDINSFWQGIDVDWVNRYSPMFRTQSYYLNRADGKPHPRVKIFRFEDFAEGWRQVNKDLGINLKMKHVNASAHRGVDEELTPRTKERISSLYAEDFRRYYD